MKTVSIVCEYNPFHHGHKYQLDEIKAKYGEDVCIVAVMSGNYTQRGDFAIADKFTRAKIAVLEGVSLVLELPFPYSMQSAEFFASAAVKIITDAVHSDVISFGSECADADKIMRVAKNINSREFNDAFDRLYTDNVSLGHPKLCEMAYGQTFSSTEDAKILRDPNNVLGVEYTRAIDKSNSNVEIHTFARVGAAHDNKSVPEEGDFASASAIRELMLEGSYEKALSYLPSHSASECKHSISVGAMPTDPTRLSNAVLAFLRINKPTSITADAVGGLEHRLHTCAIQAKDLQELITLVSTKRYTNARIRRAIWNSYFGITSSDIRALPEYTQVLAMDDKGRRKLREMKKSSTISILTKPADYVYLADKAKAQAEISNRADLIFSLSKPSASAGNEFLRSSPYCKK